MIARTSTPVTRLRTIDETAALLAVSKRTVQRLIESGALRAHRLGRKRFHEPLSAGGSGSGRPACKLISD
jgi:excisionase family DNA binding protein